MVAFALPASGPSGAATVLRPRPSRSFSRSPAATSPGTFRRRRLVVAAVASGVLVVTWLVLARLGGGSLSTSEPPSLRVQPISETVHVVQPGDTVWGIARDLDPGSDPRRTVDRILEARGGRPLQPGERIVVPAVPPR